MIQPQAHRVAPDPRCPDQHRLDHRADARVVRSVSGTGTPDNAVDRPPAAVALATWVSEPDYPCLGAKAALARGSLRVLEAGDITSAQHDVRIVEALQQLAWQVSPEAVFVSLAVLFAPDRYLSEAAFEAALWQRLQALHEIDRQQFGWDPQVSSDPATPWFSLSLGGRAYYVIGLHPSASRPARRFAQPALVFNLHSQFEQLRADGRYAKLRAAIIARDVALAGSSNPMLSVHGEGPEARQYSGRRLEANWVCPFHAHSAQAPP